MRVSKTCDLVHHVQQCTTSEARVQESRPFWLAREALFTKDIACPCQETLAGVAAHPSVAISGPGCIVPTSCPERIVP